MRKIKAGINPLSSAEAPRGWGRWIGGKKVRLGRREDFLPSVPRALSFTLSPASKLPTRPSAKEASAEEKGVNPNLNDVLTRDRRNKIILGTPSGCQRTVLVSIY